ncbi:Response regulator receiver [Shewanella piezotolerans WP3]|uniref:Response regulator receiver n=1 Tax=Shewanella piezotolerans (strain WP3 / JCM 13877) TaxID=225849 RepID=B8CIN4_SHEPW|nr:response regulator [Shewanella piezotolerans]ACJ27510.1 Response regulator receiver [Shewanella piezotolerans WP3]
MISILLAEDDVELSRNMVEILELEGFAVTAVTSAEEAIEVSGQRHFDIALLDLLMSGMTGVEAISNLRQNQPFIAVIIITAYATVDTAVDAMKKGADSVITKPFKSQELIVTIRRSLTEKQLLKSRADLDPDLVYSALANPNRRKALRVLAIHKELKFMDLCRLVEIDDHTKFNFHLRQLKKAGLVMQNEKKIYILTNTGQFVLQHYNLSED